MGINHLEVDTDDHEHFYNVGRIIDQGDLSTYFGYQTLDAQGYKLISGKLYPETLKSLNELSNLDIYELLRSGYTYVKTEDLPETDNYIKTPIHVLSSNYELPPFKLGTGVNPTFLLKKDSKIIYAVINGFLIDLNKENNNFKNALQYK